MLEIWCLAHEHVSDSLKDIYSKKNFQKANLPHNLTLIVFLIFEEHET